MANIIYLYIFNTKTANKTFPAIEHKLCSSWAKTEHGLQQTKS